MTRPIVLGVALLALAACARSPDAIAPVAMPPEMFAASSCSAARSALDLASARLAGLSELQRQAVTGDALGVFLIGVPVSSLTGADKEGLIATEKGRVLALQARLTGC